MTSQITVLITSLALSFTIFPLPAQAASPAQASTPAQATTLPPVSTPTSSSAACTITGTSRSDTLTGTARDDVICGLGGNDTIRAGGGNDTIRGGSGTDTITGGAGNDVVDGGAGNDSIDGGAGSDSISGAAGNDKVVGGTGDDTLLGNDGRDNLSAGTGDDAVSGGGGVDSISSGSGNDTCANDPADRHGDSCTIDTDAPTISFSASNSDRIEAGSSAVFRWVATDVSGVFMTWAQAGGPPGWVDWCGFATPAERIEGTAESGTYELRCAIPDTAVNERYTLFASAADALGNSYGSWAQFDFSVVNGSSDNLVPQINGVRLPATVRVGDTFTVDIDLTDESGTVGVYSWFRGETPNYFYDENGQFIRSVDPAELVPGSAGLVAGDFRNGTFRQTLVVSAWAPPGRYSLLVSLRDTVGNRGFIPTEYFVTVTE